MIARRTFLSGLTTAMFGVPRHLWAQAPRRVAHVVLYSTTAAWQDIVSAGLRDLGWPEGSVVVEWRNPGSEAELQTDVQDTIGRHPDVFIMGGPERIRAAMKATRTIPIVGIDLESDPVATGFVQSLARPGRNVSGVWMDLPELTGKQLQYLREAVPRLSRVGVVWDDRIAKAPFAEAEATARALNISLHPVPLHRTVEADDVMKRLLVEHPQAILLLTAPVVFTALSRLAELARQNRLPSICPFSTYPASGGLLAYGPDFPTMWRQTASYVDRILKGAKVGDLPVERPSKFVLIVNLKTSKALGLTIPQSVLARADQVIE
jgi:putative tryptophan/tyrosine transport system substrate-binding protein